jgi:valyl-tRNA synthetase
MSKSLGNGIDPLEMIDQFGTDAVRLSLVIGTSPGNDLRLSEEKIGGYRNFVNKIWNGARFALMNVPEGQTNLKFSTKNIKTLADKWILSSLQHLIKEVTADLENDRFSEAGTKIYDFTWSQYCDWYLEISKGEHLSPAVLIHVLKTLLKLLHPFVPFITETLWKNLGEKNMLIGESWPVYDQKLIFKKEEKEFELIKEIISAIRSIRSENNIEAAKKISLVVYAGKWVDLLEMKREPITRMARLERLEILKKGEKMKNAIWKYIDGIDLYIPLE